MKNEKRDLEYAFLLKSYREATSLICEMENERLALKRANRHLIEIINEKDEEIECLVECLNAVLCEFREEE